jgi:hypothetical protein
MRRLHVKVWGLISLTLVLTAYQLFSDYGSTPDGNHTMICFVTSVFGTSVDTIDKLWNVANIFPNDDSSEYEFLLFTNLENFISPGWTNIVLTDLPYRRFITQSRWGKFVGWRHEGLAHCDTVIYMDGYGTHRTVLYCFAPDTDH